MVWDMMDLMYKERIELYRMSGTLLLFPAVLVIFRVNQLSIQSKKSTQSEMVTYVDQINTAGE